MDDLDIIFSELEKDIEEIAYIEIPKKMKEVYKEEAIESYSEYTPLNENTSRYRNGIGGSFADEDNYRTEIEKKGSIIDITMYNDRESDCNCSYCQNHDTYLDYYIEEGIAGHYSITPRPVTQRTQLKLDNEIDNIIDNNLKSKGYNIT